MDVKDKYDFSLDFDLWASYSFPLPCRGSFHTLMLVVETASGRKFI